MLFKRIYDDALAQASYLIACTRTGEALVVDPNRDSASYLDAAEAAGVRITHVTETHIHADFLSGSRDLARKAGARVLLSAEGGQDWQYAYAAGAGATLLTDGDHFDVGCVRVDVLHTPGHTPEHLTFLVTDTDSGDRAMGALTGDFIFVGDVGRPDLLERAANVHGAMQEGARSLFASLARFKERPDYLQIWPGHGPGSACGKSLGAMPQSTLGYERLFNWALASTNEREFTRTVLDGQPEPPRYFAQMKRLNKAGPRPLDGFPRPERLPAARLRVALEGGALVVDTRRAADFAERHAAGTLNIPLNRSFANWAGWFVPYDRPFYLVVDESQPRCIDEAVRNLALIGLDDVAGYFGEDAIVASSAAGASGSIPQIGAKELAAKLERGEARVLDVRGHHEWEEGHLPGVENIPLGLLPDHLAELQHDVPLVLQCQGGSRSAIAASLLAAIGFRNVANFAGGFGAWEAAGHAVERGEAGAPA
ncbi:MAG: MBL fold metallo-hydrolase [Gemmatimonadaceae bacterium]